MELTEEKSQEQANLIQMIALYIEGIDIEYCTKAAEEMKKQVTFQESIAVLNPSYLPTKNDILNLQAEALEYLINYTKISRKIQKLRKKLKTEEENQNNINDLFL
jgi:hypothetical protein